MSTLLRLGIIGLSPGNGHPYSWAAIFNGYDAAAMEQCGFPVIPRYLEKRQFPKDAIADARVTHVWTQDLERSRQVASAALIPEVVPHFSDLLGQVDAVLLARDDAENHLHFARPFLDAGMPIYVDKPLALSRNVAEELIGLEKHSGQLFSCSAMRYAPELQLTDTQRRDIGEIRSVAGSVAKDWDRYAVHVIEPLLRLIPDRGAIKQSHRWTSGDRVSVNVEFEAGIEARISTFGDACAPLGLRVSGSRGWLDLQLLDVFGAFRSTLQDFVDGVRGRKVKITHRQMLEVVEIIELGRVA